MAARLGKPIRCMLRGSGMYSDGKDFLIPNFGEILGNLNLYSDKIKRYNLISGKIGGKSYESKIISSW